MDDLNNYRQLLMQYNMMTEKCFMSCTMDFMGRALSSSETDCVSSCVGKFVAVNHRTMKQFMVAGPAADRLLQQGVVPSGDMAALPPQMQQQH